MILNGKNIDDKIFDLRAKGLAMWEIAAQIWDDDYEGERPSMSSEEANHIIYRCGTVTEKSEAYEARAFYMNRKKQYEKLLYCEGGVYDTLMGKNPDGLYDFDGVCNLMNAISGQAADDYGESRTYELKHHRECKTKDYITAKGYFLKGKYDEFMQAVNDGKKPYLPGKDVLKNLDKQAIEGRWLDYRAMEFTSEKKAWKMVKDHPFYARNFVPIPRTITVSKKTGKTLKKPKTIWKLVLKQEVNDK